MVIFLGNLPVDATEAGVCALARLPANSHVRIIKKKARDGSMLRFGLIQLEQDKQAHKIIRRLNDRKYLGNRLVAREYHLRVTGNERRRVDWRQVSWDLAERRGRERRIASPGAELLPRSQSAA